jgi:uncharacterized membrane protein YgcG
MRGICPILSIVVKTFLCYVHGMRCPYCRSELDEQAGDCPSCSLNFPRAMHLLGAMPRIMPGIQDLAAVLTSRELRKLQRRVEVFEARFPQMRFHMVAQRFSTDHPMDLYAFWMFNSGVLSEEAHKGSENRDILLLLDPVTMRVALMVGYGLEPYLPQRSLDQLLIAADPALRRQKWLAALLRVVDGLDGLMETAAKQIAETSGVVTEFDPDRIRGLY